MIKWVNGVCSFFATFRLLHHFLGYFSSAPQKVSYTEYNSVNDARFCVGGHTLLSKILCGFTLHCFQQ